MVAQLDKTGTVSLVCHALLDKIGIQPPDHADAQSVQTGMELHVSAVSEEDNGTLKPDNVFAHQETGTVFHVSLAPPDNNGTQLIIHVHVQLILSGMVSTAELVQEITDTGTIKSTIVFAELETGMVPNVLFVQLNQIGMEKPASLVMAVDCGIHSIWFVNVLMILNGTVLHVSRPALTEKLSSMVFVSVHKVNSNKKESVLITQLVKLDSHGTENNVLEFHASVVLHTTLDATVAKPQFMLAPLVHIGMDTDVFILLTSAQLV